MLNAAHSFSLAPGTLIEEYRIVAVLGQGSFGITYLAEDTNLGTRLAIKEYLPQEWAFRGSTQSVQPKNPEFSNDFEQGQSSFLKEARLLARIAHPNVVRVQRFFRAHGTAYIAMDFVEGRSLGDMLHDAYPKGGYPAAALKDLLMPLLGGLGALHEAGIIHRDIKPGNIVIQPNGNPVLVDFGAARHYGRGRQAMTVIVTPGYAPIEQYSEDSDQGPFTDLYALGALAYRAIAGEPPQAPFKRLAANADPPAMSAGAGRYAPALLAAIDWALAVQPQDRPQTAAKLLERLRAAPAAIAGDEEATRIVARDATVVLDPAQRRRAGSVTPRASQGAVSMPGTVEPVAAVRGTPPIGASAAWRRWPGIAAISVLGLAGLAIAYFATADFFRAVPPRLQSERAATGSSATAAPDASAAAEDHANNARPPPATESAPEKVDAVPATLTPSPIPTPSQNAALEPQTTAAPPATPQPEAQPPVMPQLAAPASQPPTAPSSEAIRSTVLEPAPQAAPPKKPKAAPPQKEGVASRVADARCIRIVESSQLMGAVSDEDKIYLRDHCH